MGLVTVIKIRPGACVHSGSESPANDCTNIQASKSPIVLFFEHATAFELRFGSI